MNQSNNQKHGFFRALLHLLLGFWKIQISISAIFIILICIFSLITNLYTYQSNYKEIYTLSSTLTKQSNKIIAEHAQLILNRAQMIAETVRGNILTEEDVSLDNQRTVSFLLNALSAAMYVDKISIVTALGNSLEVETVQSYHAVNPTKKISQEASYALHAVDRSGANPHETWKYLDNSWAEVERRQVPVTSTDARLDSWYVDTTTWPRLHWYSSVSSEEISVSAPVIGANNNVIAAVNVSLSIMDLANTIVLEQLGKSGRAVIATQAGEIIIPPVRELLKEVHTPLLAQESYEHFRKSKEQQFTLTYEEVKYLVDISIFQVDIETSWLLIVIIPFNDFFGGIIDIQKTTALISIAILALFALIVYTASKYISSPIITLANELDLIQEFDFQDWPPIRSHVAEIISLQSSIQALRNALRSFTKYVPREVVQLLMQQNQEIAVGGEKRDMTLLFSDIENFTTITESFPIDQLTAALSEYFETLTKIIVRSEGTIDKFMGDGLMVFWNAPHLVDDQGSKACIAALACLKSTHNLHEHNPLLQARTRFGLHSGEAIVGNIGTSERINYTVIGNVVNTAARLQALNKVYGTSIIISESVHEKIGPRFVTRPLDFIAVKGRVNAITIFELAGLREGEKELVASSDQIALCQGFTKAYEQFVMGKTEEAKAAFAALHEKFPADRATQIYLERLK